MDDSHMGLVNRNADLLEQARRHPLYAELAAGNLPIEILRRWFQYEFFWARDYERFLSHLASMAPKHRSRSIHQILLNMSGHLEEFQSLAIQHGTTFAQCPPTYLLHTSTHYLLVTARTRSYAETLAACYGVNRAMLDAFTRASAQGPKEGLWKDLIDQRSTETYQRWVGRLALFMDEVLDSASRQTLGMVSSAFRLALHYTLRYWDGTYYGYSGTGV